MKDGWPVFTNLIHRPLIRCLWVRIASISRSTDVKQMKLLWV
jgi:hypothetical protein